MMQRTLGRTRNAEKVSRQILQDSVLELVLFNLFSNNLEMKVNGDVVMAVTPNYLLWWKCEYIEGIQNNLSTLNE